MPKSYKWKSVNQQALSIDIIRLQMRIWKNWTFLISLLWSILILLLTSLQSLFAESNQSQRGQLLHILSTSWRGHSPPVPNKTRNHMASLLISIKLLHRTSKSGLKSMMSSMVCFISPSLFCLLETGAAWGHWLPPPCTIRHKALKVSPLLSH